MDQTLQSKSVDEWINQLAADDHWGAHMDRLARETIRAMQGHNQDYTIADLYRACDDSDYREQIDGLTLSDGRKP